MKVFHDNAYRATRMLLLKNILYIDNSILQMFIFTSSISRNSSQFFADNNEKFIPKSSQLDLNSYFPREIVLCVYLRQK